MAWIILGALVVSASFYLMVFRQVSRSEERLRAMVIANEARISRRFKAKLVAPAGEDEAET
ncbi:MAG: hypothetical protein IPK50_23220 [Fibrobacterota bacterium]|nr:hypothetical protein [Fibrobacterota bacterium]QQS05145.1 MAG: hypothetical protein IPK50_23220 [Fibrobacterota bacterium]